MSDWGSVSDAAWESEDDSSDQANCYKAEAAALSACCDEYVRRITELEAESRAYFVALEGAKAAIIDLSKRVEQAEAEVERLKLEVESVRDEFCGDCEYLPKGWHS